VAEAFTCGVDGEYRSACKDLPKYPGTRYCVLHEPGEEKSEEDFLKVKESKLARKDYDFGGAIFPRVLQTSRGSNSMRTWLLPELPSVEPQTLEEPSSAVRGHTSEEPSSAVSGQSSQEPSSVVSGHPS
jgi:hypothetical protein